MIKMRQNNLSKPVFEVILIAIIFDPKTKKILIGRREKDPDIPQLTWHFPEGRLNQKEDMDKILKSRIKQKTGLDIENLGAIFSKIYPEKKDLVGIYFLCEAVGGKERAGNDFKELKWVRPKELERYFTTSFHPMLKEYLINLGG
ncbi:MAG: NUDIX domain-containing protein [Candidatus Pacearchaeota archaeon]